MKKWTATMIQLGFFSAMIGMMGCKNQAKASQPPSTPATFSGKSMGISGLQSGVQDPKKLYKIKNQQVTLAKGQKGQAGFAIKLVSGAKIHPKAPFVCEVSASAGLKVEKKNLGHPDTKSSKDKATKLMTVRVGTGVVAKDAGKQHVKMDCAFFVCTKELCMRTEENVKIATHVK